MKRFLVFLMVFFFLIAMSSSSSFASTGTLYDHNAPSVANSSNNNIADLFTNVGSEIAWQSGREFTMEGNNGLFTDLQCMSCHTDYAAVRGKQSNSAEAIYTHIKDWIISLSYSTGNSGQNIIVQTKNGAEDRGIWNEREMELRLICLYLKPANRLNNIEPRGAHHIQAAIQQASAITLINNNTTVTVEVRVRPLRTAQFTVTGGRQILVCI